MDADQFLPADRAGDSPDGSMIALRDSASISIVSRDGTELRVLAEAGQDGWLQAVQPALPDPDPRASWRLPAPGSRRETSGFSPNMNDGADLTVMREGYMRFFLTTR